MSPPPKQREINLVGRGSKIGHSDESLTFGLPFAKDFEICLMTIDEKDIDPAKNVFRHPGQEFPFLLRGKMTCRHAERTFDMSARGTACSSTRRSSTARLP